MEIKQLEYFLAVCEQHSYNQAAKKLYLSRQALRQSIAALENEIGAPLFLLQKNRLYLTMEGERLSHDAVKVMQAYENLIENNVLPAKAVNRKLTIGIDDTMFPFMAELFMPKLNSFAYAHPEIEFLVSEKPEKDLLQDLRGKACDCVVIALPSLDLDFLKDYTVVNLVPGKPAVYIRRDALEHYYSEYPYEKLEGKTILFPGTEPTILQKALLAELDRMNIHYSAGYFPSVEEVAGNVRDGNGNVVSFCTYPGCKYLSTSLSTLHIPMEDGNVGFHLAMLIQKEEDNPILKLFMKYLDQNFTAQE